MSRVKLSKTAATPDEGKKSREWPAVVYFWAFGLAIFGYAAARVGLDGFPHPYHWMTGIIGGVVGIPVGWLWYRRRGDVI